MIENEKTVVQSHLNKARDDKFLMVFDIPPMLKGSNRVTESNINKDTQNRDSVQFAIYGTAVPEITIPATETRYAGNTFYVSSHAKAAYPPVSVKFNVDSRYTNYWTIYRWLDLLHDEYEGRFNADEHPTDVIGDYKIPITVYGLDENNNKVIEFLYTDAFPISINNIEFDYQNGNEIVSGFTFVYSQIHVKPI
jgi:hypothetical protein